MAALCLNPSLEMLWPLCYHGTHCLQGDLCRCFHKGSLQAVQVVVTLLASHVLQKSPQFIVPGLRSGLPKDQSSVLIKVGTFLHSHSWVVSLLGFWAGTESCWKTHSWLLKRVMLSCFTSPCSTSSWCTRTPVSPLFAQMKCATPCWDASTKPWCRKNDGNPAPSECTSRDIWA